MQNVCHRMRKPTVWVYNQVRHKLAYADTEAGEKLEILDLSRWIVDGGRGGGGGGGDNS